MRIKAGPCILYGAGRDFSRDGVTHRSRSSDKLTGLACSTGRAEAEAGRLEGQERWRVEGRAGGGGGWRGWWRAGASLKGP